MIIIAFQWVYSMLGLLDECSSISVNSINASVVTDFLWILSMPGLLDLWLSLIFSFCVLFVYVYCLLLSDSYCTISPYSKKSAENKFYSAVHVWILDTRITDQELNSSDVFTYYSLHLKVWTRTECFIIRPFRHVSFSAKSVWSFLSWLPFDHQVTQHLKFLVDLRHPGYVKWMPIISPCRPLIEIWLQKRSHMVN